MTIGIALRQVMLAEGQALQIDLDVTKLLPGGLEATVLDGAPLPYSFVFLRPITERREGEALIAAKSDAAGRCTVQVRPATTGCTS